MIFSRAGYLDITEWYQSERHEYGPHEMATGDWAAAVYYDGIDTSSNQAAWLTNLFRYPDIYPTNSPFDVNEYSFSNDTSNPVWTDPCQPTGYIPGTGTYSISSTGNDTAWSTLDDDKLAVKIYYEVVDLGEQDANGVGGSPLSFRDANDIPVFVYSERFVLLQTYIFKNLSGTTLSGLEFYQMMHGHPADAYSNLAGCYETADFYDPLADYIPCDPNHQVGNFRYDITLWNVSAPWGEPNHFDWMSFSSTIAPNSFGFDEFTGAGVSMEYAIRNRTLNGRTLWANNDMAGAAKWNLGNLAHDESKSITLALMYGVGPIQTEPPIPPIDVNLTKTDNLDDNACVEPSTQDTNNLINYTICYTANEDVNDVYIVDELPTGLVFEDATGSYS
jgi:hypothetical protein